MDLHTHIRPVVGSRESRLTSCQGMRGVSNALSSLLTYWLTSWNSIEYGCVKCTITPHLEIKNARVVVVLSREECRGEASRMHVSERVCVGVPPAEAQVKTSDAGAVIIDNDDLLVM